MLDLENKQQLALYKLKVGDLEMFRTFLSISNIKELIEMLLESKENELEVCSWGRKIRIKKGIATPPSIKTKEDTRKIKLIEIKSPMVGTIYLQPPSDSEPPEDKFEPVEVGETIQMGQVVCMIEAMKIPNKIESEVAGLVVEILVETNQPVQFGQVLFLVDPQS